MATTIGTEYDHIDITNGVSTIRHPLKDASAREKAENLVAVQDTQPQSNDNVIWVKETPESEIQVPTYDEFSNLKSALNVLQEEIFIEDSTVIPISDNDKYINTDGTAKKSTGSAVTDYFSVLPGETITLSGLYLTNARSVCGYTNEKTFETLLESNSSETSIKLTVPSDVYYIRATTTVGGTVTKIKKEPDVVHKNEIDPLFESVEELQETDENLNERMFENEQELIISIFREKKCYDSYGNVVSNNSCSISNLVKVEPDSFVTLNGIYVENPACLCGYSKEKNFVSVIASESEITEISFYVPKNVYYLGITTAYGGTIAGTIKKIKYVHEKQQESDSDKVLAIGKSGEILPVRMPPVVADLIMRSSCRAYLTKPDTFVSDLDDVEVYATALSYGVTVKPENYKNTVTNTVYVDGVNGDDENDGSKSLPFKTLEAGIESGADTIYLKKSIYKTSTGIISENINLIGIENDVVLQDITFSGEYQFYVENITFIGAYDSCLVINENIEDKPIFCANKCVFTDSITESGLAIKGEITARLFDCIAYANYHDGFNYKPNDGSNAPNVLEVNCEAYSNGDKDTSATSDNGSTGHYETQVIRVNGYYHDNHGGNIADTDHTLAWNVGCKACNSLRTVGNVNNADYWARNYAVMYCENCYSEGSEYDGWAENHSEIHISGGRIENVHTATSSTTQTYTTDAAFGYHSGN